MILITGANGTVGNEVARQLVAAGVPFRAFVRSEAKAKNLPAGIAEIAIGDFAKPATLDAALQGVDRVFLASFDSPELPDLQGNFIDAAKRVGVRHIARLSAMGADPEASTQLIQWHGLAERRLESSRLSFTHLRPNWFMQNFLLYAIGGVIRLPVGDAKTSFVDVRDIAAVAVKTLVREGHEGKTYTLTGPQALTHNEVAAELSAATGKTVKYEAVPPAKWAESWPESLVELYAVCAAGEHAEVTPAVERVTGKPSCSFASFARDFAPALTTAVSAG